MVGVVHVIDLLQQSLRNEPLNLQVLIRQPLVFPKRFLCFRTGAVSQRQNPFCLCCR
jgi:CBS domain containing-hemolysin-like protein